MRKLKLQMNGTDLKWDDDKWLQPFRQMWEAKFRQLDNLLIKMQYLTGF